VTSNAYQLERAVLVPLGGCFDSFRATTHDDPVFNVGAVPHTSTSALTNVPLPYALALAKAG
jgi:alanine dehydrogenase